MHWYGILWTDVARVLGVLMSICFVLCLIFCPRLVVMPFRSLGLAIGGLLKAIMDVLTPGEDEDDKDDHDDSRLYRNYGPIGREARTTKQYKSEFGKKYSNRG